MDAGSRASDSATDFGVASSDSSTAIRSRRALGGLGSDSIPATSRRTSALLNVDRRLSTRSIAVTMSSSLHGLWTNWWASRRTFNRSPSSVWPDRIRRAQPGYWSRTTCRRLPPCIPGIRKSDTTTSQGLSLRIDSASSPLPAKDISHRSR